MAQIRTSRLVVLLVAPLLLAGCGGAAEAEEPIATATTTVTATPTPSPSASTVDAAALACAMLPGKATLLAMSWELVLASRGAADHADMIDSMSESIDDYADEYDGADCSKPVELAELGFDIAMMRAATLIDPEDDQPYADVAEGGNEWAAAIGASDVVFAAP